jgi:hypothetical protein
MIQEYAAADRIQTLREALAHRKDEANLVGVVSEQLAALQCAFDDYKESAYLVDEDSSKSKKQESKKKKKDTKSRHGCGGNSESKSSKHRSQLRGRSKSTDRRKKNKCKHCKDACLYAGKHDVDKCFYNKKYKGWRPSKICKELGVTFKHRHEFMSDMGGFTSSALEESGSGSRDSNSSATSNE